MGEVGAVGRSAQGFALFSHYRAVPSAVAGLISLAVEEWAARRMGWKSSRKLAKRTFQHRAVPSIGVARGQRRSNRPSA
jgi:hypothetical protein